MDYEHELPSDQDPDERTSGQPTSVNYSNQVIASSSNPERSVDWAAAPEAEPVYRAWGAGAGISVWLISVALTLLIPLLVVLGWVAFRAVRAPLTDQAVQELLQSRSASVLLVSATFPAHVAIVVICWAVATRMGRVPFRTAIGWNWANRRPLYWLGLSVLLVFALEIVAYLLPQFIPEKQGGSFEEMLNKGLAVRVAVAIVATISAPFAEEFVYRGLLFSGLAYSFGKSAAIALVTLIFTGVHVFQYYGHWASITALAILSLILTLMRDRTGAILPCIVLHLINNAVQSVGVLISRG